MRVTRWATCLAGLWAGVLLGVGLIGAPAGFVTGLPETAGRAAGRMFMHEATLSLVLAVVMFLLLRRPARSTAPDSAGSVFSLDLMLTLGALFCTVAGYFAVQPMMAAARAGQGALSFAALHGISAGFYAVKTGLVLALAWRLTGR
jgi:hypothetical protein